MNSTQKEFELKTVSVRLVEDAPIFSAKPLNSPEAVYNCIGDYLSSFDREVVAVVYCKTDGSAIACSIASMGSLAEAMMHPREMFKAAFLSNAYSMVLVHNHPSGNLYPSKTDTMITDRMIQACTLMGIPLVDHIIVGGKNKEYFSFKEKHLMDNVVKLSLETDYMNLEFLNAKVAEKVAEQAEESIEDSEETITKRR